MKIQDINRNVNSSLFAVIPMSVLLDVNLTDTSKLLYAHISANFDHAGTCDKPNGYFSSLMGCSLRTIQAGMTSLLERGYIERSEDNKEIRMPSRQSTFIQPPKEDDTLSKQDEELIAWMDMYLERWESAMETKKLKKKAYYPTILERLETWTREELETAMEQRIAYVNDSDWHNEPENLKHKKNLNKIIRDDKEVLKCLQLSDYEVPKTSTNLKRDTVKFEMDDNKNLLE